MATDHPRRIGSVRRDPFEEFRVRQEARLDLRYDCGRREDQTAVGFLRDEIPTPWMRMISAPHECAPRLLRILSSFGITGSTMFPGYEGVVRSMRERELWER
jgi:hypothetical protein